MENQTSCPNKYPQQFNYIQQTDSSYLRNADDTKNRTDNHQSVSNKFNVKHNSDDASCADRKKARQRVRLVAKYMYKLLSLKTWTQDSGHVA